MPSRSRVDAVEHISHPRLKRYLDAANGNTDKALDLYEWNEAISGALFQSISGLEVALRNALHTQLTVWCANDAEQWYEDPKGVFTNKSKEALAAAVAKATTGNGPPTPGQVVSQITFGFWRFLFTAAYQETLWVPCLRFALKGAKRKDISDWTTDLHTTRNRIAHHEAIYQFPLEDQYESLIKLAEYVHPRLGWWIDSRSRVPALLAQRP